MAARAICRTESGITFKTGILGKVPYQIWLLENRTDIIGKQVTVNFFGYTKAGRPRHGKLKTVRDYE